ncbi:MAG: response regulator transcription factor [Spirochaetales bacterium]|nr:response regulator transcription factor [Spirochaetales bacterium]
MKANILIIEDEEDIARLIGLYLKNEGMDSVICATAERGMEELSSRDYDLIVLDINLPGMDGFEFLQRIRKESGVPTIIVSARKTDEDLILGLGIGADEYVVKPFSPRVLAARIRALLRRAGERPDHGKAAIHFGAFTLSPDAYTLMKGDKRVALTVKEFEVLLFLAGNAGKAFTANEIYEHVWNRKYGELATVAIHIQRLRRKIEDDPSQPVYIQNIYGAGYFFNEKALDTGGGNV